MALARDDVTLETYAEKNFAELGLRLGPATTLKRGTFGPEGKRIRVCLFDWYLLFEMCGQTIPIPLGDAPTRRLG